MSFKRFDTEDIVVSSDSISSPAWTNNIVNLTSDGFEADQVQISTNSGNYYHNLYNTGSELQREVQFSVAYGHRFGSGSLLFNSSVTDKSYSKTVYGQFRTLLNGDEDTDFQFGTSTPNSVYFISVERARFKEKILPGSLTLNIGNVTNNINLTDNGVSASVDTFKDGGREYLIYEGSEGRLTSTSTVYGKLYPDTGIIVLNGDVLASAGYISAADETNSPATSNIPKLYNQIRTFTLRSEETISSNYIFVRARNSEFNYSTNPSNITGSGELQHDTMIDTPQAYITAVGLYNDNNDLLAVSKLSKPLLKDFSKEALIRIKLDY